MKATDLNRDNGGEGTQYDSRFIGQQVGARKRISASLPRPGEA